MKMYKAATTGSTHPDGSVDLVTTLNASSSQSMFPQSHGYVPFTKHTPPPRGWPFTLANASLVGSGM